MQKWVSLTLVAAAPVAVIAAVSAASAALTCREIVKFSHEIE